MTLIIFFILSLFINILLVWYLRKVLYKLLFVSDNIDDLLARMEEFSNHVERIYGMETYYGDEVLQGLVEHSKEIVEAIQEYEGVYTVTRYLEQKEYYGEEEEEE
tara:strand:- start:1569 stop:1883 length:315 start_codon:yes stop_codon:yes gene_type:complete